MLPFYFFIVAVSFNIAKWVSFNVRILSTVRADPTSYYNKYIRIVYYMTAFVIAVPTISVLIVISNQCSKEGEEMMTDLFLVSSILFILISALFLGSGLFLSLTLKNHYEHFYHKSKKIVSFINLIYQLMAATLVLSISLLLRATLNLMRFSQSAHF